MKFLVVLSALTAVAVAKPGFSALPYAFPTFVSGGYPTFGLPTAYTYNAVTTVPAPAALVHHPAVVVGAPVAAVAPAVKTQYHSQDALGQAAYGHSEPFQSHDAVQDAHGNKVGSFSYVAPSGQVFRTDYVADALGYRVSSNALPVSPTPVADTPEVIAARSAHLAAHHYRTKRSIVSVGHTPASTSPLGAGVPLPTSYSAPVSFYANPVAYAALVSPPHAYYTPYSHLSYLHK